MNSKYYNFIRWIGDLCVLLQNFPKLSAYRMDGKNFRMIYFGSKENLQEVQKRIFKDEEIQTQFIQRVPLWKLDQHTQQWLEQGADLVIIEQSRISPWTAKSSFRFSMPEWIHQELALSKPPDKLLSGSILRNKRWQLNQLSKLNMNWYFSSEKKDFDLFHYQMYRPFISARHEGRALISDYKNQHSSWLRKGGVLIATQDNIPKAGILCALTKNICQAVELGMLMDEDQPESQHFITYLFWSAIQRSYQQEAAFFNFGSSHALISDGSFITKKRWGSQVVQRNKIYRSLNFAAKALPTPLADHLNQLGCIHEEEDQFWLTHFTPHNHPVSKQDFENLDKKAQKNGLSGVKIISY